MELKILSNIENTFLKRKEITFSVDQNGSTASRAELKKEICKRLNLSPESTIVVKVDQGFGHKESTGTVHSYQSRELMERSEPEHIIARSGMGQKKQEAPAPPEQPKAEEEAKPEAGKKE
ncbi:MAG: hypothetical protein KGI06_01880 [Candidatus Micrarchaeota archaeon]|nr:hypothetical protein [Candidatus Micrarchaeota archaeon]